MDWQDKHFQAWVCEQIGIEYNGLPLAFHHKQRFLALKRKKPFLEYPGPPKERNVDMSLTSKITDSRTAENVLLTQYDAELKSLEERKTRYQKIIEQISKEARTITKRRNMLAKLITTEDQ
jgi:hypothetical protein